MTTLTSSQSLFLTVGGASDGGGGSGGGGSSVTVIDNLTSNSVASALSARQGRVLDLKISTVGDSINSHADLVASETELGHVKIDNDTIKFNVNGQIYAESSSIIYRGATPPANTELLWIQE